MGCGGVGCRLFGFDKTRKQEKHLRIHFGSHTNIAATPPYLVYQAISIVLLLLLLLLLLLVATAGGV